MFKEEHCATTRPDFMYRAGDHNSSDAFVLHVYVPRDYFDGRRSIPIRVVGKASLHTHVENSPGVFPTVSVMGAVGPFSELNGRSENLISDLHLVQMLRMSGAFPPQTTGVIFTFTSVNKKGSGGTAPRPGRFTPDTHWTGGWVGPRAVLNTVVKIEVLSPPLLPRESNPTSIVTCLLLQMTAKLINSGQLNSS
jgi:hypothetical protein